MCSVFSKLVHNVSSRLRRASRLKTQKYRKIALLKNATGWFFTDFLFGCVDIVFCSLKKWRGLKWLNIRFI